MSVIIGSARISEKGTINGTKGDQKQNGTGNDYKGEVSMQVWYLHSKGWVLIRPRLKEHAERIAQNCEYACNNPEIGYGQKDNRSLYELLKDLGTWDCRRVDTPVNTDCAQLGRVEILYAGIDVGDFYTANAVEVIRRTGAFDIITDKAYTESDRKLRRGDMLVTKTKGHFVTVLSDGPEAWDDPQPSYCSASLPILEQGMTGQAVKAMQLLLIDYGYNLGPDGADGDFGPRTATALQSFQRAYGMSADAICGKKSWHYLICREA